MSIDEMDVDSLFSLERVPFSTFGSWNAISIPKGETELFFRSFHGEANNLFPMRILGDRKVVTLGIVVEPRVLSLINGQGQVDICFERPGTVRMRGRGLGFQLGAGQPELAMDQILTIADHQDEFGCFPDSINDVHITYNFSKPPVHGMACRENFHAVTGSPLRCPSYTWTSSVFLLLAERLYQRAEHVVRRELHEN